MLGRSTLVATGLPPRGRRMRSMRRTFQMIQGDRHEPDDDRYEVCFLEAPELDVVESDELDAETRGGVEGEVDHEDAAGGPDASAQEEYDT